MPVWIIGSFPVSSRTKRRRTLATIIPFIILFMLAGCSQDDPHVALDLAAQRLQESIEEKDTGKLMALIHPQFSAQQRFDDEWVRRTATLMFLRHRNVRVLALSSDSWVDPTYPDKGHSEAQVALTGADGLLPQRAGHYSVRLEWWKDGENDWQLARLEWD